MASVAESIGKQSPIAGASFAGVEAISADQTVVFTKYHRLVLPLDGFVFWVRADLLGPSALYNSSPFNTAVLNQASIIKTPAPYLQAQGSLHFATDTRQEETETYSVNRVTFSALEEIQQFNDVGPTTLYIGRFDDVRFAFSSRKNFYKQAGLWHYVGNAIYSDMESQIIDSPRQLSTRQLIVSNSLPAWLALNGYEPLYPSFGNPTLPLYPSFLVPENLPPPYAAVHIPPEATRPLQKAPYLGRMLGHQQLAADKVRVTIYGGNNATALDFVDCVNQYSLDVEPFGLMNSPLPRDEKRTQPELGAIAMKKTIEFEVSYVQRRINHIARQLILSAIPTYAVGDENIGET